MHYAGDHQEYRHFLKRKFPIQDKEDMIHVLERIKDPVMVALDMKQFKCIAEVHLAF